MPILPWKILESRYVYNRAPYMILREDTVLLPNGARIQDYFVFEYPDWACVLAITRTGEVVLIRQYRHGIAQVHYELPSGVVDPGEDLLDSARRELLEETGYGGGEWHFWLKASANPATHTNTAHIFLALNVEKVAPQELDDTEDISVHLLPVAETLQMLETGGVYQALHAAALWKYFYRYPPRDQP